jgi:hypothetical protein
MDNAHQRLGQHSDAVDDFFRRPGTRDALNLPQRSGTVKARYAFRLDGSGFAVVRY